MTNEPFVYWWGFRCVRWGLSMNDKRSVIDLGPWMIMVRFNDAEGT